MIPNRFPRPLGSLLSRSGLFQHSIWAPGPQTKITSVKVRLKYARKISPLPVSDFVEAIYKGGSRPRKRLENLVC